MTKVLITIQTINKYNDIRLKNLLSDKCLINIFEINILSLTCNCIDEYYDDG